MCFIKGPILCSIGFLVCFKIMFLIISDFTIYNTYNMLNVTAQHIGTHHLYYLNT